MRHTITVSNISFKAFEQGNDLQVLISGVGIKEPERWFTIYSAESFDDAVVRVFGRLAEEYNTTILPII